jgi:hypothetical protein
MNSAVEFLKDQTAILRKADFRPGVDFPSMDYRDTTFLMMELKRRLLAQQFDLNAEMQRYQEELGEWISDLDAFLLVVIREYFVEHPPT